MLVLSMTSYTLISPQGFKEKGNIKLTLSDASGMSRSVLLEGNYEAGEHFTSLESSVHRLVSGLYFVTLRAGNQVITQKLIILN